MNATIDNDQANFDVYIGDEFHASTSGPIDSAFQEALNYARQYAADGPVTIYKVTHEIVWMNGAEV